MSGIGFFELVILFMIGLVVLGPKRLPKVANQLGSWIGQARRMTRVMRRQLEEELNLDDDLKDLKSIKDELSSNPLASPIPRDDDTYSPLHEASTPSIAGSKIAPAETADDDDAAAEAAVDEEDDNAGGDAGDEVAEKDEAAEKPA